MAKIITALLLVGAIVVYRIGVNGIVNQVRISEKPNFPYLLTLRDPVNHSTCTAFFAKNAKNKVYVVSAGHCVDKGKSFIITDFIGRSFSTEVIEFNFTHDFTTDWALLKAPNLKGIEEIALLINDEPIDFPALTWFVSIYAISPIHIKDKFMGNILLFEGLVRPGESGSPIIWHENTVIGIVTFLNELFRIGGASNITQIPQKYR